jgi:putative FmdB family regulatory protein
MPLYEYECQSCGRRTETLQRMDEAPLTRCPDCGGPLKKLISTSGFQLKGSGWYRTDYARQKSSGAAKAGGAAEDSAKDAKPAPTETKDAPAAKAPESPAKTAS